MAKTMAEQVAERMGNDGTVFYTEARPGEPICDGAPREGMTGLWALARAAGAWSEKRDDLKRWIFPDGSAITVAAGAWDLGYTGCWCWRGAGHTDACVAGEGA